MMQEIAAAVHPDQTLEEQVDRAMDAYVDNVTKQPALYASFVRELPALGQAGAERGLGVGVGRDRDVGQLTVSVPTMPPWRWPGTLQKNVYLPGLSVTVRVLAPPWNVGVAPTTAPLVPFWMVKLWPTGAMLVKLKLTFPALAVSVCLSNLSWPLGSAAIA